MSEEQQVVETEQEVTAPPSEAVFSSQEPASRDFEAEAREMGWVPETEFRGPKERWKSAEQFVVDGETVLPIVRSQLQREREKLDAERKEFQERIARIERVNESVAKRQREQYESEINRLRAAQREAVQNSDVEAYDRASVGIEQLSKQTQEPEPQAPDTAVSEFSKRNDWYGTDVDLTAYAEGYSQSLVRDNPSLPLEENLRRVEARVKEVFPAKFAPKTPAAHGHAAVDGGGLSAIRPQRGKSSRDLPPEAKAAGDKFVRDGLFKDLDAYAKEYFANE